MIQTQKPGEQLFAHCQFYFQSKTKRKVTQTQKLGVHIFVLFSIVFPRQINLYLKTNVKVIQTQKSGGGVLQIKKVVMRK